MLLPLTLGAMAGRLAWLMVVRAREPFSIVAGSRCNRSNDCRNSPYAACKLPDQRPAYDPERGSPAGKHQGNLEPLGNSAHNPHHPVVSSFRFGGDRLEFIGVAKDENRPAVAAHLNCALDYHKSYL